MPLLPHIIHGGTYQIIAPAAVAACWPVDGATELGLAANLSGVPVTGFDTGRGRTIWQEGEGTAETLGPYAIRWFLDSNKRA